MGTEIIINALQYKPNSSGIGVLIRELFGAYVVRTERSVRVILPADGPEFPMGRRTEQHRISWDHRDGVRRMLYQTFRMSKECKNAILLTTDSKTPFFLPRSCILLPIITDLALYRMPAVYRCSRVFWWKLQYKYLRRHARMFFAISEFTKREIMEVLNIPPEKIHVIPCACAEAYRRVEDTMDVRRRYALNEPYILFVGNFNPRKNLERLLKAFDKAKESAHIPHQLVIAGEQGWKFSRDEALKPITHKEDIRFIGFVSDKDMPALYSAASLFAFPALYEGFGLPVLEAQHCGVPVLTSNCSSLPEVGGEGALYVDPYDEASIADGLLRVLKDQTLADRLVQAGYENAGRYSWIASAEKLLRIIEVELTNTV